VLALFLPAVIFFWVIGWGLYWIGHQRQSKRTIYHEHSRDDVSLKAIILEEPMKIVS
jgi:hypothetical protein